MRDEFKILLILVITFCASIILGMVGVFFGKVDPQFVEGLVTGGLVGMITTLFKDVLNLSKDDKATSPVDPPKATVAQITPIVEVKP